MSRRLRRGVLVLRVRCPFEYAARLVGHLWLWLQLMWLQIEAVRGPVGVVWGRFGAGLE